MSVLSIIVPIRKSVETYLIILVYGNHFARDLRDWYVLTESYLGPLEITDF